MSARDFALIELDCRHLPRWPANLLPRRFSRAPAAAATDPRDRALAGQIFNGVVKNLLLLQNLVAHHSGRNLKSIDPLLQKILAIALYQLRYLRIPSAAAVHEAVEQTRRIGQPRASGFVNAVLRNALRQPDPPPPDPARDPAALAEQALSHPRTLFQRLADLMGPADALQLCRQHNLEPPTIARLFPGHELADLHAPDVRVIPHQQPGLAVVDPARPPVLADWAQRGIAQVQDPTAAAVAAHLRIEPGQSILDRCAGLGTKTLQMQALAGDAATVLAMDPAPQRCYLLEQLVRARGMENVRIRQAGMLGELPPGDPQTFDRVLIDVPCSNSGVLARRPEARYHQSAAHLASLAELQDRILDDTAPATRPGGLLAYSTCSIWPEENQARVAAFLARHSEYRLLEEHITLPSLGEDPTAWHDGGYCAILAR